MESFQLESYLSKGVERIVTGICKAAVSYPRSGIYLMQYAAGSKTAARLRSLAEERGEHIPPFLIASITEQCNLRCKGCYARANQTCGVSGEEKGRTDLLTDCRTGEADGDTGLLSARQWEEIFEQAAGLGVGFILLAGGEPFLRKDVLSVAGRQKKLLFPVFTNGTVGDEESLGLLSKNRNLIPILSLEGSRLTTDARRGEGVFDKLQRTMKELKNRKILFGASVTITNENAAEVMDSPFLNELECAGCKAVIFVEYVPINPSTAWLAPDEALRNKMELRLERLRKDRQNMLFLSFPGDEKSVGGCLAAGRGFFHINAKGGAEPCPFSPHSDTSLSDTKLRDALRSPLFLKLHQGILQEEHTGGCVLFEQEQKVKEILEAEEL